MAKVEINCINGFITLRTFGLFDEKPRDERININRIIRYVKYENSRCWYILINSEDGMKWESGALTNEEATELLKTIDNIIENSKTSHSSSSQGEVILI